MRTNEIFITEDGSHSILSEKFGVSYHSKHGAIQESQHVFIEAALHYKVTQQKELDILEIGLGTGHNAYMTFLEATQKSLSINYIGVEAYPISIEDARALNYPKQLNQASDSLLPFHDSAWNEWIEMSPQFRFKKLMQSFHDIDFENQFDIIYFDAFAPNAQEDLWEALLLSKMYKALKINGVLTTYCAKGVVKRTLKSVGFTLESIPGPPGKREMTRAIKNS